MLSHQACTEISCGIGGCCFVGLRGGGVGFSRIYCGTLGIAASGSCFLLLYMLILFKSTLCTQLKILQISDAANTYRLAGDVNATVVF